MGRRGKKFNDLVGELNDGGELSRLIEEVRGEVRGILEELEFYRRVWVVPWFVQRSLDDLHKRLELLFDKLGGGERVS
jgi:hypothetical protein